MDHNSRYTGGGRSCWGGSDPRVKRLKMRIIEEKSESSISDTQDSSEDRQINKRKDVNEEGKEINLQSQADGVNQEIYCIKLPGAAKIDEGEPENQNHAVAFTKAEALHAIDMN
ncbi:hypothetical protein IEQ34_020468 [Dendrobium chrysotoxum]|uniref:Glycosyl transferase 48 domain-containing protein n=1 Tax=Dendrobium chrysotoxum TaxID=161865 RepID=A0AAV7G088_DENCH|nr:hypothetical protein IEQ34_020468 [Dendrobium chrysotoxum]